MILVRITDVIGDSTFEEYKKWFTATGFEFEVGESNKSGDDDDEEEELSTDAGTRTSRPSKTSKKGKKGKHNRAEDWDYLELSIDKEVDSASVYLMHLAMKCRASVKITPLKVDIHVMEQKVREERSSLSVRPFLVIRLEDAYIGGWNINGDEGGKVTESLTIWYDKAAMKYTSYLDKDGKETRAVHGPLGWSLETGDWKCDDLAKS